MPRFTLSWVLIAIAVVPAQEQKVRGRLVDDEGAPIAGVAACPFVAGEKFVTAELAARAPTTSDADGAFVLDVWPSGDARFWDSVLLVASGRLHMEVSRDEIELFPIVLPRGRVLAGRVRDATGRPVVGVRVEASDILAEVEYLGDERPPRGLQARTAARTDARGAFVLAGACGSAARVTVADLGWRRASAAPVSTMDPIDLSTAPEPTVEGVVVDADGAPVVGALVSMHSARDRGAVSTDAAGAFAFPPCAAPMRLSVRVTRDDRRLGASTTVMVGETKARLVLKEMPERPVRPARSLTPVTPARSIRVTAVDPEGKVVEQFRAAAFQVSKPLPFQEPSDTQVLREFDVGAVAATAGVATPAVHDLAFGAADGDVVVVAFAESFAIARQEVAAGVDAIEVRFAAALPLTGTVIDAKTRMPIPAARVWWLPRPRGELPAGLAVLRDVRIADASASGGLRDPGSLAVAADATGTFRLAWLPAGAGEVFCRAEGYKSAGPLAVTIGPAGAELGVELDPLRTIVGTLQMRTPPLVAAVRFAPHRPNVWTGADASDYSGSFPLDPEGRFQVTGLATGKYEAQLIVLCSGRLGLPEKIPLGLVDIGNDTDELRLAGAPARPARVRGKVETAVPAQRLAVLSAAAPAGRQFFAFVRYEGPLCPVAPDGTFDMQEPAGSRQLVVIDVWTGAMLTRTDLVEVAPGGKREVDLRVDAVPVTVQLGGKHFDPAVAWRIEVEPAAGYWPEGVGRISTLPKRDVAGYTTRIGATFSPGQTSGVFYLPPAPCKLLLRMDRDRTVGLEISPRKESGCDVRFEVPPK